jgi:hypothetical protein
VSHLDSLHYLKVTQDEENKNQNDVGDGKPQRNRIGIVARHADVAHVDVQGNENLNE